jgi:hypothetical protein
MIRSVALMGSVRRREMPSVPADVVMEGMMMTMMMMMMQCLAQRTIE